MKHERRGSEITEKIVATARRIPITGWFVGILVLGVSTVTLLMFSTSSVIDPEYKDLDTGVVTESHTKNLIIGVNKTEEATSTDVEEGSTTPANSGSVVDIKLGKGNLITDTTKNPLGLPIYDGYTHEGEYFDVDFSRFWNSGDIMSGLGDYESKEKSHIISHEGAGYSKVPIENAINQYRTSEGRLVVALGPGVIVDPVIYEPEIDSFWANPDKYTASPDWCKGTTAIVYKAKVWDNQQIGMYVDCVLEDGTVIAMIIGDEKALHKGLYNNSEYCFDYETKGYAHVRQDKNTGYRSYSIIELCGSGNGKKAEMNLAGNKIVKFRCYTDTKNRFN